MGYRTCSHLKITRKLSELSLLIHLLLKWVSLGTSVPHPTFHEELALFRLKPHWWPQQKGSHVFWPHDTYGIEGVLGHYLEKKGTPQPISASWPNEYLILENSAEPWGNLIIINVGSRRYQETSYVKLMRTNCLEISRVSRTVSSLTDWFTCPRRVPPMISSIFVSESQPDEVGQIR